MVAIIQTPNGSTFLSPEMMLPDLLAEHPQARGVFDRYGLRGCGGPLGPVESLSFFARSHGVDEAQLLAEIKRAIEAPTSPATEPIAPSIADTIYRRFFTGAMILILSAGATWGMWLLWRIGMAGKFTGISIHDVNAHGHAQIFGWVGLFIMGFAYQAFPRLWHTDLVKPRLAVVAFILMVLGLIIRTTGMTLANDWSRALPAAMLGGVLEVAAILIFVGQILTTFRRGHAKVEPYVGFAVSALAFMVAMSFMSIWHTYTTMSAKTQQQLLWYVATYQAPLRDLQIHGLALLMILGVSIRMLPALFGVPEVSARRAWSALGVLLTAVVGEVVLFIAYRWSGNHILAAFLMIPWLMLTIGSWMIARPMGLWAFKAMVGQAPPRDRSWKFVRAAYFWLAISLVMLLLLPAYQAATKIPFSHAYYGAIRHAITVGFISLMILGFAAKVVPTLNGIDTRRLTQLYGPFILVNVGCFLRVSMQTLTDFYPGMFFVIGISGTLEVIGMAWWGLGLVKIMRQGKRQMSELEAEPSSSRPVSIEVTHRVSDILVWFPETQGIFDRYGFTHLRNPVLRRTLARTVTLSQAAGIKGVSRDHLVRDLNQSVQNQNRHGCS